MTPTPSSIAEPSERDFERLGVRPQEYRLSVIRRAATRAALGLARTRDAVAGDQLERHLSEIATSAYRLLDPRRRADAIERAHVGRILPGTLQAAGQTKFHLGPFVPSFQEMSDYEAGAPILIGDSAIVESNQLELWNLGDGRRIDVAHNVHHAEGVYPALDLRADDLVRYYGIRRRVQRVRYWIQHPKTIVGLICALLFTSVWLVIWQQISKPSFKPMAVQVTEPGQGEVAIDASAVLESMRKKKEALIPEGTLLPNAGAQGNAMVAKDVAPQGALAQTDAALVEAPAVLADASKPTQDTSANAAGNAGVVEFPQGPMSAVVEKPQIIESTSSASGPGDLVAAARGPSGFDKRCLVVVASRPKARASADTPSIDDDTAKLSKRLSGFNADECLEASQRLVESLLVVDYIDGDQGLEAFDRKLSQERKASRPGSLEHYVASLMRVTSAWFSADAPEAFLEPVRREWMTLSATYDVRFPEFIVSSLKQSLILPCSAELNERLVSHAIQSAECLVAIDALPEAEELVAAMLPVAKRWMLADEVKRLEGLATIIRAAKRGSDRAQTRGSVGQATSSESLIIGRHLCFTQFDWEAGLPWLADGSDARLASLAKTEREVRARVDAASSDYRDLASGWQVHAERMEGRVQVAMRLKAANLLSEAIERGTTIEKALWSRELETLRSQVASELVAVYEFLNRHRQTVSPPVATMVSASVASSPIDSATRLSLTPYLEGTLAFSPFSEPVSIRYAVGEVIDSATFSSSRYQPLDAVLPIELDMEAEFQLDQAAQVRVAVSATSPSLQQTVYINENVVEIDPLEGIATIDLPSGTHHIRWLASGRSSSTMFLALNP